MRLQHNIMAKSAYRSYKKNVSSMKQNLERLSSGYKINRAADDAAGLAISEKMRAQITGEETAQKNARDGISLVQTAEGALTEVHDILDRMVELATQSANGTYDNDTDRYQLQKELGLLMDEINRIADSSNFNGIPLLDGSMDAGGSIVYNPGSFQINNSTLHPAGLDAGSIELPDVGPTLGGDTVLHTEGTVGGDTNAFSLDLHNVILNANSTISIAVGDGVSITVTNHSDEPVTAKDIAAAINGNSNKNITVDYGNSKVGKSEKGNVTVTLGKDSVFELNNSGTRLTFTQVSGGDIEMSQNVKITDATAPLPKVEGPSSITPTQDSTYRAKYTIDLSGINVSAPGQIAVSALGREFDLVITGDEFNNRGNVSIGKVLADKLAKALTDAKFPPDSAAGALKFSSSNGTVTVEFDKDVNPAEYEDILNGNVTFETSVYKDGETVSAEFHMDAGGLQAGSSLQEKSSVTVTIDDQDYTFYLYTPNDPPPADNPDPEHTVTVNAKEKWQDKVAEKLNQILAGMNKVNRENGKANNANYNEYVTDTQVVLEGGEFKVKYQYITKQHIGISDDSSESPGGTPGGPNAPAAPSKNFSGDYNKSTTVLQSKSGSAPDRLASTVFDLEKLAGSDGLIAEGTTITIGRDTYTFTYDADKIGKDGYVVLNGGENPEGLAEAAVKLTKAAERNGTYTVGHDGANITITEREGQTYFDLTTMEGIEKSLGFKTASTTLASGAKGMTFQIGETADSYNQVKFSIKDCHTLALGIDAISIADQRSAAEAVNKIRAAVDYVSDVRGTLGAAQNRLDHTVNNLGVMAENVQEAESAIRDADIAEEMMAYTKNNILIQSAQSMLAQANQVPQGVLQLLQ